MASLLRAFILAAAATAVTALPAAVTAHDLGTHGQTFNVIETDLLKLISARLHEAQANGSIDRLNREFAERAQKKIENPPAVTGISDTRTPKTWLFDPSIISPADYADQNGRVFAHKGEKINPLEKMPGYNKVLVFINGKSEAQVAYAEAVQKKYGAERTRMILTDGSPISLDRKTKDYFYFDQGGVMTTRFGIAHVPATVIREADLLRISEVTP